MKKLLYTIVLLSAVKGFSQVGYDNNPSHVTGTGITAISVPSFNVPAGGDRVIIISLGFTQPTLSGVNSITYNGQNLIEGVSASQNFSGNKPFSKIWYAVLGTGGAITSDVDVQFATTTNSVVVNAASYHNVNQLTPVGSTGANVGGGPSTTIDLSTNAQDGAVDNLYSGGAGGITAGINQTEVSNVANGNRNGSSFEASSGTTVAMSWTKPNTSYTHSAMELNQCTSCNPLPVELVKFEARKLTNNSVELFWQTASEINNSFFSVERSTNGQYFQEIEKMNSLGNSFHDQHYSFIDTEPKTGINQYRLKQVGFDGKSSYSRIVSVTFDEEVFFKIFPNPSTGNISISCQGLLGLRKVILINQLGAKVWEKELDKEESENQDIIFISGITSGLYHVVIENEIKWFSKTVLVK